MLMLYCVRLILMTIPLHCFKFILCRMLSMAELLIKKFIHTTALKLIRNWWKALYAACPRGCMLPWWHRKALTQWPPFLNVIVLKRSKVYACWKWPSFRRHSKYSSQFHGIWVFWWATHVLFLHSWLCKQNGGQTGPRAVNELGGPVIPGSCMHPSRQNWCHRRCLRRESN